MPAPAEPAALAPRRETGVATAPASSHSGSCAAEPASSNCGSRPGDASAHLCRLHEAALQSDISELHKTILAEVRSLGRLPNRLNNKAVVGASEARRAEHALARRLDQQKAKLPVAMRTYLEALREASPGGTEHAVRQPSDLQSLYDTAWAAARTSDDTSILRSLRGADRFPQRLTHKAVASAPLVRREERVPCRNGSVLCCDASGAKRE